MMKWRKPSPELIHAFEAVIPGPPAVQRQMFGFPAAFVNGNMFMGLHQEDMILRLPEDCRTELLKVSGARVFEPMPGRPMHEYIVVPPSILADRYRLASWAEKARDYGLTLKPKDKKTSGQKNAVKSRAGMTKSGSSKKGKK